MIVFKEAVQIIPSPLQDWKMDILMENELVVMAFFGSHYSGSRQLKTNSSNSKAETGQRRRYWAINTL